MITIKSFFRNPKNKIYMILFCFFFVISFVLQAYNNYCNDLLKKDYYEHTMSIFFSSIDYDKILSDEKLIKSYSRILSFYPGENNQYITSSVKNGNSSSILTEDKEKFLWSYLTYMSKENILVFPASAYREQLDDNEVILYAVGAPESNELIKNKEISFLYNNKYIPLNVKKVEYPTVTNFVLISDNLFNELVKESTVYIYCLDFYDSTGLKELEKKYKSLERDGLGELTYVIGYKVPEEGIFNENLEKLVDFLSFIMKITSFIFSLIIILMLIILVKEELSNNRIFKQLGFSKTQIEKINILNLLFFDIVIFSCSVTLSFFVSQILNNIFKISLLLDVYYIFKIILIVIFLELIISVFYVFKRSFK